MLKEALEYLIGQSAEKLKPIEITTGDIATKTVVINGEIRTVPVAAKPRDHKLSSLEDLILLTKDNCLDDDTAAVFFNEDSVSSVLDYGDYRRNIVTFKLSQSDAWKTISEGLPWMNQKDFVRLLRIRLADCLPANALLDRVRRIKVDNGQTVTSEVSRRKESLGKSITAEVSGDEEIPETVALQIPVYKSLGERDAYTLRCSIEVDPTRTDAFKLAPFPDEMERVQHLAMQSIRARIAESLPGVPAFYGHP